MSPKEVKGLEKLWKESSKLTKSLASRSVKEYLENLKKPSDGGLPAKLESPRPVITYIWRDNYKRSVLNTHDILYYILSRFNVTLKVTTLQVNHALRILFNRYSHDAQISQGICFPYAAGAPP